MPFPISVRFRGVAAAESIEREILERATKLDAVSEQIVRCDVVVQAPHHHQGYGGTVHVRVSMQVPGTTLVVDQETDGGHDELQVAIHDAFLKARRCLVVYNSEHKPTSRIRRLGVS